MLTLNCKHFGTLERWHLRTGYYSILALLDRAIEENGNGRMRLYIVRHGETELNRQFRFIGRTDIGLSPKGRSQAKAVADRLRDENIKAIYSSDLLRAMQTAEVIAGLLSINIRSVAGLREIDFGDWEGMTYEEIDEVDHQHFHAWVNDPTAVLIPRGEIWEHFEQRVRDAINGIVESEREGNVVVVSHGGPIRLIMTYLCGGDSEYFRSFWPSPGGLSIVQITEKGAQVLLENGISYKEDYGNAP